MGSNDIEILTNKYQQCFVRSSVIGKGTFGKVLKVWDKNRQKEFALKIIWIKEKELDASVKNEINIIKRVKSIHTVELIDAWFGQEDNKSFVYIQMELAQSTLYKLMVEKQKTFGGTDKQIMSLTEYLDSLKLFGELTECLNYLHSLEPPIIHRDLKPENVLIFDGTSGKHLKLCDFGLAKTHEKSSHTRMIGTMCYMAPEVKDGRRYNTKADVYSLCVIGLELFGLKTIDTNLNINKCELQLNKYLDTPMELKLKSFFDQMKSCLMKSPENYNERPSCQELAQWMTGLLKKT